MSKLSKNGIKNASTPKQTKPKAKPGIVLSASRYNEMVSSVCRKEDDAKAQRREDEYEKFLKEGSRSMVERWDDSFDKAKAHREAEHKKKLDARHDADKKEYLKIKEKDERVRREKIAKAEQLVLKGKAGPRELESAAILSEVLKGRNIQRNINDEFDKMMVKRAVEEDEQLARQALPWIEDEQKRIYDARKRHNQYKSELYASLKENEKIRNERNMRSLKSERSEAQLVDADLQSQILRERELLARKRETLRQNALEAMLMVEQRRMRDRKQDEIDQNLNQIFNDGKESIAQIRKTKDQKSFVEKLERIEANAKQLQSVLKDERGPEEAKHAKEVAEMNRDYFEREKDKIQKNKAMKEAKIREYLEEQNRQKELKRQKCEEFRFGVANRLKNDEVNANFQRAQKREILQKKLDNRSVILQQIEEKRAAEKEECDMDRQCSQVSHAKEDGFFFNYADNLIADAKAKARPLHPFVKAVAKYKKDNLIDQQKPVPPQLQSHLTIGVRTPRRYDIAELKLMNSPPKCCS